MSIEDITGGPPRPAPRGAGAVAARLTNVTRGFRVTALRDYGIVLSFVVLFLTLTFASDVFLTKTNLLNILDQTAPVGIMAVGGTLVFIAGGFDLSVGAVFAISSVIAAQSVPHIGPGWALVLGALSGFAFGAANGFLVNVARINAFIATLGSAIMLRGLALVMTGGLLITVTEPSYSNFGRGDWLGVKYGVWTWLFFALVAGFLLSRTTLGRYIYASGGNPEAARLSGIRVGLVRTITFLISGFSASIAGILVGSRVATGQAAAGLGIEFTVIAGIVIGGISIFGGEGAIWRSILGVLLLTMIGNGFVLMNIQPIYTQIIQGAIILLAVAIDSWSRRSS
ncbi:MAG: ABC transporter permease [Gaiellaceae bacterium]